MEATFGKQPSPPIQNSPPATHLRERHIGLDFLRGIAIVLVLARHYPLSIGNIAPAKLMMRFGWTGVDLFFVLSGFLIGGLLFQELKKHEKLDLKRFYIRRIFKIWPAYYLAVGVSFLQLLFHSNFERSIEVMWPNFFHIQNYIPINGRRLSQSWSLAVEEHFYLILPVLIAYLWPRTTKIYPRNPWKFGRLLAAIIVICVAHRMYTGFTLPIELHTHVFPTHQRIDSLLFGVFIGYLFHYIPQSLDFFKNNKALALLLGFILLLPMMFIGWNSPYRSFLPIAGFTLLNLGYSCVLLVTMYSPAFSSPKVKNNSLVRVVAFIGFYSYPIYLWHILIADRVLLHMEAKHLLPEDPIIHWMTGASLYVFVSAIAGAIMGNIIDKPALALREKLFPAR